MGWEEEIGNALVEAVREIPAGAGILFSGGLDSSLIAHLSRKEGKDAKLYSACTEGSHDCTWSRKAASMMGMQVHILKRNDGEIIEGIRSIKRITNETSPLVLLIELPLYFIAKDSKEAALALGQGADELFLGYKKYERENTSKEDFRRVIEHVAPLERKIADSCGKKLVYPYLDKRVIDVASSIPYNRNVMDGTRKGALRDAARSLGLAEEIAMKQKKASQYSSGFKDAVSRMARESGMKIHEFMREL